MVSGPPEHDMMGDGRLAGSVSVTRQAAMMAEGRPSHEAMITVIARKEKVGNSATHAKYSFCELLKLAAGVELSSRQLAPVGGDNRMPNSAVSGPHKHTHGSPLVQSYLPSIGNYRENGQRNTKIVRVIGELDSVDKGIIQQRVR